MAGSLSSGAAQGQPCPGLGAKRVTRGLGGSPSLVPGLECLLSAPCSPGRKVRWERKPAQSPQACGPQAPALSSHSPTLTPAGTAQCCPVLPRPWLWSLWPGPYRKGLCPPPLPIQPGGGSGHTWHWG